MIPSSFIQDLLARTNIVDIVGSQVSLKKSGINHKGLCPFHGEKSPSFVVSASRQTYHCFGCGVHGNAIGFLMESNGLGFIEAVKELAQTQGISLPEETASPQEIKNAQVEKAHKATIAETLDKACAHWRQQLKSSPRAINYLKARGLTGSIAAHFALGYAPENWRGLASVFANYDDPLLEEAGLVVVSKQHDDATSTDAGSKRYDRFRDRIMFPIRSVQGKVIGFGARVIDKGEPKYLNSPETALFIKGRELYGLYEARSALRNKGYALVTEGYMDVVALAQWGFANAVATLGTACSDEHLEKLFRFTQEVVFSFDGDAPGRKAAGRALQACLAHASDTRRIRFLFLPEEHDPDSFIRTLGAKAFETQIQQAIPLSRQLLVHAAQDCDLSSAEGRTKLLAQAVPMLAKMPDGLLVRQICQDLAQQVRVPLEQIIQQLQPRTQDITKNQALHQQTFDRTISHPLQKNGFRYERSAGGRQARAPARPPIIQAASPLERIAWLLMHRSDLWDQLTQDIQKLLCEQNAPLGVFFSCLDRLIVEQGPLQATAIETFILELTSPDISMQLLFKRLGQLHVILSGHENTQDLMALLRPIRLQALKDELDFLHDSGTLSQQAKQRERELIEASQSIRLEISRENPSSGSF